MGNYSVQAMYGDGRSVLIIGGVQEPDLAGLAAKLRLEGDALEVAAYPLFQSKGRSSGFTDVIGKIKL